MVNEINYKSINNTLFYQEFLSPSTLDQLLNGRNIYHKSINYKTNINIVDNV